MPQTSSPHLRPTPPPPRLLLLCTRLNACIPVTPIQYHIWDTFNNAEYKNPTYNPDRPGHYKFPLKGETDDHMSNFFVGKDPDSSECAGFDDFVDDDSTPTTGASQRSASTSTRLGCYDGEVDGKSLFTAGYKHTTGMTVQVRFFVEDYSGRAGGGGGGGGNYVFVCLIYIIAKKTLTSSPGGGGGGVITRAVYCRSLTGPLLSGERLHVREDLRKNKIVT